MAQCSVACCKSSYRYYFNDHKMAFFTVPSQRTTNSHRGKDSLCKNKKMNIKNCQHKAWIDAIDRGYENGHPDCSDARNVRARACHFHPSMLLRDSEVKHELKIGASPAMHLTKFSIENDDFKEKKHCQEL